MPTFIDLFCGAGGFSRGFVEAGYKLLLGLDIDPACVESYSTNFPDAIVVEADIREVHSYDILRRVGRPDVVIASPPCEAFTKASKDLMEDPLDRLYTDPIGRLTLDAIRMIGDIRPRVFVIENVPGILEPPIRDSIKFELRRYGYDRVYFNVIDAEKLGCPSMRRRVFISNVPIRPKYTGERKTVWDAIGDLPDPRYPNDIPNHEYSQVPPRFEDRVRRLKWGQGMEYFMGSDQRVFVEYVRLHPYELAPTVMGRSRFIHPFDDRLLTVREQARLMTYPDSHVFCGNRNKQYDQVGESVPPLVSYHVAKMVLGYLV